MLNDLFLVLGWWLVIGLLGLLILPLMKYIFRNFFDYGYPFAKIFGLVIFSYIVWLLSSLHLIAFNRLYIIIIIAITSIGIFLLFKIWRNFSTIYLKKWRIFVIEEIIFLIALIFWAYIRGLKPDIQDLEKFMDFGFINSILRTKFMPPLDMWYAGHTINYYYFGHYFTAFLIKLINYPPAIAYNLMLATIFAFSFTQVFCLGANLFYLFGSRAWEKITFAGIISATLFNFGGNLHTLIYAYFLPFLKKIHLYSGTIKTYWYADATRYIGYNPPTDDKTIHEFPSYSFVVADLHGHLLDIPIVLSLLILALGIYLIIRQKLPPSKENLIYKISFVILISLFLAVAFMTNTWDFAIYILIIGLVLLFGNLMILKIDRSLANAFFTLLGIIFLALILASPFIWHFHNISQGIRLVKMHTIYYQWFVLWGYQLLLIIIYFIFLILTRSKSRSSRFLNAAKLFFTKLSAIDFFVIILALGGIILIILPELIYVKDIYYQGYPRANTMFKLVYGASIIFAVISGYMIMRIAAHPRSKIKQVIVNLGLLLLLIPPLLFPFWAIPGYYQQGKTSIFNYHNYQGLDGLNYLKKLYPDNWQAINWINSHISDQPTIVEANGDSYSNYDQISMATGLPTIQGWLVHEWLWRGNYEEPAARGEEVGKIYQSPDNKEISQLLKKYHVKYLIIGPLEMEKYTNLQENQLLKLGQVVFNTKQTKIIKINDDLSTK